jgi:N-acetylglucosamine-6-phosphate deacetylase
MDQQRLKIYNGNVLTPSGIIQGGTLGVSGNKITEISKTGIEMAGAITIDAGGRYIVPGFIDMHVHGGGGCDFMDGNVNAFLTIAATHARYGTTAMLPTTLSASREELLQTLSVYEKAILQNTHGSQFLGMHLEGPYLSLKQCGAQDPRFIRDPDPAEYKEILSRSSSVRRWSAAPELPGALEFGRLLESKGILVALAHTDAIYEEVVAAVENGYTLVTHLYSGMSGVTRRNAYRHAGVIESAFLMDELDVEIIADGIHVPAPLLQLVYKIKGVDKTVLITDAMRAAGMPEGESILGSLSHGIKVIVEDGVAKLPDRSSFAGSVATADCLVRNMIQLAGVSLPDAVKMMTITPAKILGVSDQKGSLERGKDADIVIFDENIRIATTIINGKVVYDTRMEDDKTLLK